MDHLLFVIPILVFAGIVRGYSGFGFTAIAVVGMNMVFKPQDSVIIMLALDLICSIGIWKSAIKDAEYSVLKKLLLGSIIGIPIGHLCLLFIPAVVLKFLICVLLLLLCILLFKEYRFIKSEKNSAIIGCGITSGICTSSASVGGPIIVYYMLTSKLSTSIQRSTMILYFVISEFIALGSLVARGNIEISIIKTIGIVLLPTLIAVRYGQKLFLKKPPKSLKSFALPVLLVVSILGIIKTSYDLFL